MSQPFLPPDAHAHADAVPPPPAAAGAAFPPPAAGGGAKAGLAFGSAGLGLLAFTAGLGFPLTLPCSIAAWALGVRARRRGAGHDQTRLAILLGVIGVVLGVLSAIVWIVLATGGGDAHGPAVHHDGQLELSVVRLAGGALRLLG